MPDIKTRDTVKGTIKTLDKAAVAGERMKDACPAFPGMQLVFRKILL